MFNYLFPLLVCVTLTIQQDDPDLAAKIGTTMADCAPQYNFTTDYVNNQIWSLTQFPDDKNLKCFFSCVNVKLGVLDASGNIDEPTLKKVVAAIYNSTIDVVIDKQCDIAKVADVCQTAFDMMQCMLSIQNGKR